MNAILTLAVFGILPAAAFGSPDHEGVVGGGNLIRISERTLRPILKGVGLSSGYISSVTRNSQGTKLSVSYTMPTNSHWGDLVATISTNGVRVQKLQGQTAYLHDNGVIVCTASNRVLVFASGERVSLDADFRWGFSPGARVFYRDSAQGASLFRTSEPRRPIVRLPEGFAPDRLFDAADKIFVFGRNYTRPGQWTLAGFILSNAGSNYTVIEKIDLSWTGYAVDMDTENGVLLTRGKGDIVAFWRLYNLKTKKRSRIIWPKDYGFFLNKSLRDALQKGTIPKPPNPRPKAAHE